MIPARLLQYFDQISEAPDALPRLRGLILDLAVRGKLVPQDPMDEPVSMLLAEVAKGRERVIDILGLRQQPPLPEVRYVAPPFGAPDSWVWSLVDDCFVVTGGIQKTPKRTPRKNAFPYVGVANVYRGRLDLTGVKQFELNEGELGKLRLEENDLLIVEGNGSASEIGRCARWTGEILDCVHQNHIIRCRPGYLAISRFAELYLNSGVGVKVMQELAVTSAGLYNLSVGKIRQIQLPLAPLAEQHRIVAKVDELMALCDELEAAQAKRERRRDRLVAATLHGLNNGDARPESDTQPIFEESARFYFNHLPRLTTRPEHIHQLRQTILNLAVRGRLLFRGADAGCIRTGWHQSTLGEACLQITDGEHATPQRTSSGVPLVTAKNVRDNYLDMSSTDWVELSTAEKCWKRCKPRNDDILMVCVGATTGRVCRVQDPPDMVLVRSVALLRPRPEVVKPCFLELFLRSPLGQSQVWAGVKQTAQPCLYLGRMNRFVVSIPPLSEQHRIVSQVDELMALCDELEASLTTTATTRRQLLESTLHDALEGCL